MHSLFIMLVFRYGMHLYLLAKRIGNTKVKAVFPQNNSQLKPPYNRSS